jgi:hypothetical protein
MRKREKNARARPRAGKRQVSEDGQRRGRVKCATQTEKVYRQLQRWLASFLRLGELSKAVGRPLLARQG